MLTHLAEELNLTLLFIVKIEKPLINLVGTRRLTVSMIEWQFVLPLEILKK
jgi:hypothetical protein